MRAFNDYTFNRTRGLLKGRVKTMRFRIVVPLLVIASLITASAGTTASVATDTPHVWYSAESSINASAIRGDSDGAIPTDKTYCFVYGLGAKHINIGGPAAMQYFTGVPDTSPPGLGQRGINDAWWGSTVCKIGEVSGVQWMGFQVHKDSIVQNNPVNAAGWLYGAQMVRSWGTDLSRKPWAPEFGPDPKLAVSAFYAVQMRDATPNVMQYGQLTLSLVDTTTAGDSPHRSVWLTVSLWDSRNARPESVHLDTGGTANYIIDTYLAPGLQYVGVGDGSQNFAGTGSGLHYKATISEANLVAAITEVNRQMAIAYPERPAYSLNPDDWAVNFVSGGTEMYSGPGTTGWIGSRVSSLTLATD